MIFTVFNGGGYAILFRVGILDDNTLEQQETRLLVQTWLGKRQIVHDLRLYKDAHDVESNLDVLFMEVGKGEDSLLWLVKELHEKNPLLPVVVVTKNKALREEAQDARVFAYMIKGQAQRKFKDMLEDLWRYVEAVRKMDNKGYVSFKTTRHYVSIPKEDVYYFKFKDRKVKAITATREYTVQHTLKELKTMVGDDFSFCHRSSLVNLEHVASIFGVTVTLDNGEELVLSQKRGKLFRLDMKEYSQHLGTPIGKRKRATKKEMQERRDNEKP